MTFSGPTLKHFILQQQVISLYRQAVRASRGYFFLLVYVTMPIDLSEVIQDPVTRTETLAWIRSEFDRNRHLTDIVRLKHCPEKENANNTCRQLLKTD